MEEHLLKKFKKVQWHVETIGMGLSKIIYSVWNCKSHY
jgi:hypothetical protein